VGSTTENSMKIYKSLIEFGAPGEHYDTNTFLEESIILQIGVVPRRIDIITSIDGINFNDAWKNKVVAEIGELSIPILAVDDLIENKLSTGRDKDVIDAKRLKQA